MSATRPACIDLPDRLGHDASRAWLTVNGESRAVSGERVASVQRWYGLLGGWRQGRRRRRRLGRTCGQADRGECGPPPPWPAGNAHRKLFPGREFDRRAEPIAQLLGRKGHASSRSGRTLRRLPAQGANHADHDHEPKWLFEDHTRKNSSARSAWDPTASPANPPVRPDASRCPRATV